MSCRFKRGQKWLTRGQSVVTILDICSDNREFPLIGLSSSSKDLQEFTLSGRFVSKDSDAPGDLVELVQDVHSYTSPNQYSMLDFFKFLERQYLIDGAVTVPNEVKDKTSTLAQAITYMLDQDNDGGSGG